MGESTSEKAPVNPTAQQEQKKTIAQPNIYDVTPVNGQYQVTLPALFSFESGDLMGTHTVTAKTLDEANKIAIESKQKAFNRREQISLKKSFLKNCKIEETPDGGYVVINSQAATNPYSELYLLQVSGINQFGSWIEAKKFYLELRKKQEKITHRPILEIPLTESLKIAFSDIDFFDPQVAPTSESLEVPHEISNLIEFYNKNEGIRCATYRNTKEKNNWQENLYSFISTYLKKEGKETKKRLKIEHLDCLTPKQAIDLCVQVVIDLTKYKKSDAGHTRQDTESDQSTVLEILKEGLNNHKDPSWEGNGVCRNFASCVKAVFEALKTNQTKYNLLRNTYCLLEGGSVRNIRWSKNNQDKENYSHAWNSFIAVSKEGNVNSIIVDATWANRNLETKAIEKLDYTLTRMEPVIFQIGKNLANNETPNKEEQYGKIINYYANKIEKPGQTGGFVSPNEEKQYYVSRVMDLMSKNGVPQELPEPLIKAIREVYQENSDVIPVRSEIKTLYEIKEIRDGINFRNILRRYLEDIKSFSYQDAGFLIFEDRNLQYSVITEFENINLAEFRNTIENCPNFRIRMREIKPYLVDKFSPVENSADAAELAYLINKIKIKSQIDNKFTISRYSHSKKDIEACFDLMRQHLREANPEKYEAEFAAFDDYQIVKQFNSIRNKLIDT